jgi:hypothetical protein
MDRTKKSAAKNSKDLYRTLVSTAVSTFSEKARSITSLNETVSSKMFGSIICVFGETVISVEIKNFATWLNQRKDCL